MNDLNKFPNFSYLTFTMVICRVIFFLKIGTITYIFIFIDLFLYRFIIIVLLLHIA